MEKLGNTIFNEDQIQKQVAKVAEQINQDYKDKQKDGVVFVGVLRGAVIFMADIIRYLDFDIEIDFVAASSYKNSMKSSGTITLEKDISSDIKGKHVVIVEDIVDSGLTVKYLCQYFEDRGALSTKVCAFLFKQNQQSKREADYSCFDCPDEFIVGYGLDYAQKYRNLPYVTSI